MGNVSKRKRRSPGSQLAEIEARDEHSPVPREFDSPASISNDEWKEKLTFLREKIKEAKENPTEGLPPLNPEVILELQQSQNDPLDDSMFESDLVDGPNSNTVLDQLSKKKKIRTVTARHRVELEDLVHDHETAERELLLKEREVKDLKIQYAKVESQLIEKDREQDVLEGALSTVSSIKSAHKKVQMHSSRDRKLRALKERLNFLEDTLCLREEAERRILRGKKHKCRQALGREIDDLKAESIQLQNSLKKGSTWASQKQKSQQVEKQADIEKRSIQLNADMKKLHSHNRALEKEIRELEHKMYRLHFLKGRTP